MSVFVVAQLQFKDEKRYRRYQEGFGSVFSKFPGSALVADENPKILEGDCEIDKMVILEFKDEDQAHDFMDSADYREISKDRHAGAESVVLLVKGIAHDA